MLHLLPAVLAFVTAADPDPTKELRPPAIRFVGHGENGEVKCEVHNPNAEPLPYAGYLETAFDPALPPGRVAPRYVIEVLRASKWHRHSIGWCAHGQGPVAIPARGRATFTVDLPGGDWESIKVGIDWIKKADRTVRSETVWSPAVAREQVVPKAPDR
jgi:hypothetical protein